MSGTSCSVNCTPFDLSQPLNCRLAPISPSLVPQTIHNIFNREFAFASSVGNALAKMASSIGCGVPAPRPALGDKGPHNIGAELNAPIHANLSRLFKPTYNDSAPPIDNPAIARCSRFLLTLYALSTAGITSSRRIFAYPVMLSGVRPPAGPVDVP